jgi:tRNA pseudouridine38-40 synthase
MSWSAMSKGIRYKMVVAYDGTEYSGWQVQPNGFTVQQAIQEVLAQIMDETIKVHGSGRTDKGVHARAQVAHFDCVKDRDPVILCCGLNALLPPDIRVTRVTKTHSDFHSRRSAVNKEYRYFIWNHDVVPPFLRHYRTRVRQPLDVEAMRKAAALLCGEQDFAAFTANSKRSDECTVRHLMELSVSQRRHEIVIRAVGDGFLYKMVRSLAGWLIRVGDGSVEPEHSLDVLESRVRTACVLTAPPEGLFLWRVKY